jgi:putative addiction module component (TIGR02574 family)
MPEHERTTNMPSITMREINKLGVTQRIVLAEKIWESIPENSNGLSLTSGQKKELDRRLALLEGGRAKTTTWPHIRAKMRLKRLCK